jgi:hypothetical protein
MMVYEDLIEEEAERLSDVDALELLRGDMRAALDQALLSGTYQSIGERRIVESAVEIARNGSRRRHAGMAPAVRLLSLRVERIRIRVAISNIIKHRRRLASRVIETSSVNSSIQSSQWQDPHEPQGVVDQHTLADVAGAREDVAEAMATDVDVAEAMATDVAEDEDEVTEVPAEAWIAALMRTRQRKAGL